MKLSASLFLIVLLTSIAGPEYVSATPEELKFHYDRGVSLYENQKYTAAKKEFSEAAKYITIDDHGDAMRTRFYMALCAASLGEGDAQELLEKFVFEYPNSIYVNDVHFALGNVYYDKEDYQSAYNEFMTVNPFDLNFAQRDEYNFKTGYSAYKCGDEDKAYSYFKNCISGSKYYPHAVYYISYIDYTRGDLASAKRGFASIANNPAYSEIIPFYLLQIEFREGNYGYVVANGESLFAKASGERKIEIARILSESYFHLKDYQNALRYITEYEDLGGKMGREELYLAGYSNYIIYEYTKAIGQLSAAAENGNDELAQNAYFHLGDCYIEKNDKRRAMAAFGFAASSDYNKAIKEEAMFNYGKLQYELGGGAFNAAITTFNNFIEEFPQSVRISEARDYLLAAYFNSRNYEAAYEAIKLVKNPDNNVKTALQKITYFRALQYFEDGNYDKAVEFFNISMSNQFNPKYTALTKYWLAETYMRKDDYTKAIPLLIEYIRLSPSSELEHKMAQYNLAYCYFNSQRWGEAATWFDKFLQSYPKKDQIRADAYNRQGDISMAQREYEQAINSYDNAIKLGTKASDYAQYQRAIMLGLTDRSDSKISALLSIISKDEGEFVDDAMYELGRTYVQKDRFNEGATVLKNLINRFPSSEYNLSAMSELGLIYQNLGNDSEAIKYYKMVVEQFPSSPQAKDAMIGIRNIYVNRNDVDSYFAFAQKSGIETNVTIVERDSLSYAAADRVYQSGDYNKALPLMENYLKQYDRGVYRSDALYAIGDCALHTGDKALAIRAFTEVGNMPSNKYKTPALRNVAKMQFDDGNFMEAASAYKLLAETAVQAAVVREALSGYIRSAVATGDDALMDVAADAALSSNFADDAVKMEANFAKAQSLHSRNDDNEALKYYRLVAENPRTRDGAEAKYRVISILYSQGKLDEAEKEVFSFSESNSQYQYWMGKAFIILGDIYVQRNDQFQAKATYQSVIDGYPDKNDGVVSEAQEKIESLK